MIVERCNICQAVTGHKRAVGVGTLIGGIMTLGVSFLAIPSYPLRCIRCGAERGEQPMPSVVTPRPGSGLLRPGVGTWLALGLLALVLVIKIIEGLTHFIGWLIS